MSQTTRYNSPMTSRSLATVDARAALRGLSRVGEATAISVVRGLNDVAFQTMRFERSIMQKRLDRPSRFTVSETPSVAVWWVDASGRGVSEELVSSMDILFDPSRMALVDNSGSQAMLERNVASALSDAWMAMADQFEWAA